MKVLNKVLLSSLLVISASMVACGNKESRSTRAHLMPRDAATVNLQNQLSQQGVEMIVHSIDRVSSSNSYKVETKIQVGNETRTAVFDHLQDQTYTYQAQIGGVQYRATSYCYFSTQCLDYVIMFDVYYGGQLLYQLGLYKYFGDNSDSSTIYKITPGPTQISFDSMINYLANPY